jgi:hypothetical protein
MCVEPFREATRLRAGQPSVRVSISDTGKRFFSSPKCPERLWGPLSLMFSGYRGRFSWG